MKASGSTDVLIWWLPETPRRDKESGWICDVHCIGVLAVPGKKILSFISDSHICVCVCVFICGHVDVCVCRSIYMAHVQE